MADIVMEMKKQKRRRKATDRLSSPFQICISQSVSPAAKSNEFRATLKKYIFFTLCCVPSSNGILNFKFD